MVFKLGRDLLSMTFKKFDRKKLTMKEIPAPRSDPKKTEHHNDST